jgi:hypothetical protein
MIHKVILGNEKDYLAWQWLVGAVLAVFHENEARYEDKSCATKASADTWCILHDLREDICQRTCRHWCRLTGWDRTRFPYNVDAVVSLYMRIRKRSLSDIEAFDHEVAEAIRINGGSLALNSERSLFDAE